MRSERGKTMLRCAVYTRVSTEHGLEQELVPSRGWLELGWRSLRVVQPK